MEYIFSKIFIQVKPFHVVDLDLWSFMLNIQKVWTSLYTVVSTQSHQPAVIYDRFERDRKSKAKMQMVLHKVLEKEKTSASHVKGKILNTLKKLNVLQMFM